MNVYLTKMTSVSCPRCKAGVGIRCDMTKRGNDGVHSVCLERFRLADAVPNSYAQQNASKLTNKGEPKHWRANTSALCRHNSDSLQHLQCKGKLKSKHGIQMTCNCLCHKRKEVITTDD